MPIGMCEIEQLITPSCTGDGKYVFSIGANFRSMHGKTYSHKNAAGIAVSI